MRMSGHRTRAVFERDNIVDEKDLREAVRVLEKLGRVLDTVAVSGLPQTQKPRDCRLRQPQHRRAVAGHPQGVPASCGCVAELEGLWFHDLRSSFVTRARKLGISESVVIRMSGHPTRAVFGSGTTSSTRGTCEKRCASWKNLDAFWT